MIEDNYSTFSMVCHEALIKMRKALKLKPMLLAALSAIGRVYFLHFRMPYSWVVVVGTIVANS